ncbi:hypothetical protein PR002_g33217 [Phytophthora rubi]|uniref:Uncharacterized protein n=1 Tax=Phytophthora rubi TaxID=129364 RepID=A0A6A3FWM5_9STRA|nr:hypothetical protein PR002_g33217 [Phytophthora rubi]
MKFSRKRSASADEDADLHVKKQKLTRSPDERCPRLRSGLVVRHPLIVEAATMQVQSLGMFELAPSHAPFCSLAHEGNSAGFQLSNCSNGRNQATEISFF